MSTSNAVATGIKDKLNASPALLALLPTTTTQFPSSICRNQAADNQPLPFVVFNFQAGGPENIYPHDLRSLLYQVRAFATSAIQAGSIDTQISLALHQKTLTVSGYTNTWTVREADIELVDYPPNVQPVYSAGGLYRIYLDT